MPVAEVNASVDVGPLELVKFNVPLETVEVPEPFTFTVVVPVEVAIFTVPPDWL